MTSLKNTYSQVGDGGDERHEFGEHGGRVCASPKSLITVGGTVDFVDCQENEGPHGTGEDAKPVESVRTLGQMMGIVVGQRNAQAVNACGLACIAISSEWDWQSENHDESAEVEPKLNPDLESVTWKNRPVWICFDSEPRRNPNTNYATAEAPTGSKGSKPATFGVSPGMSDSELGLAGFESCSAPTGSVSIPDDAITTIGRPLDSVFSADRSSCALHRSVIQQKVDQGLSATRIRQDLRDELGIEVSYYSVRRFVRKLTGARPLPFRRMECDAGAEAQVDFGTGAPVIAADGKRRKVHVFRIVLSHSRKAYSEATFTQTTEDFLRCLENAFAHFGGVPKTLVVDNLKAAVAHPDWFDPELTPKVQSFCQHYGTVILPTKSYTPRHKGKVESSVKYVKNNALKGRTFTSLGGENQFLSDWEVRVADKRIHGTTKKQVGQLFQEIERATLLPRPLERFAFFHEARRRVNRDGHIEVAKAYYSVPPEFLGREVWVRWDSRLVRVFNHRWEVIIAHVRQEPGRFNHPERSTTTRLCRFSKTGETTHGG